MTIIAKPNQSMQDVIIQATGSLQAGMQFCADNGVSITDTPTVGTVYTVSDAALALGDAGVLSYLQANQIVIGTLGNAPAPPLTVSTILYPYMEAVKNPANAAIHPNVLGYWDYILEASLAGKFVSGTLVNGPYLSATNDVWGASESRLIANGGNYVVAGSERPSEGTPVMPDKSVNYHIIYNTLTMAGPYVFVQSDAFVNNVYDTLQFEDVEGNVAVCAPLVVVAPGSQGIVDTLLPDISWDTVGLGGGETFFTVRFTMSHYTPGCPNVGTIGLFFIDEAAGGTPDPDDPTNPNKCILGLDAGRHTMGVLATYMDVDGVTMLGSSMIELVLDVVV